MPKKKSGSKMTGNPIKVEISAWLDGRTKEVSFDDKWEADWKTGKQTGPITVPHGTAPMEIHFHFNDDDTGLHLNFMRDFDDVIYVSTGKACPPQRGNQGGQITFVSSSPNLLKVRNANSGDAIDLKYALRFNGRDNEHANEHQPYVYDPDLKNGGGGIGSQ